MPLSMDIKRIKQFLARQNLLERYSLKREAAKNDLDRPETWGDCEKFEGICGRVSCQYHLYLDVNEKNGSIKFNFPGKEVWEIGETCALRVAMQGGLDMEAVGKITGLTRERIRQISNNTAPEFATALGLVPGESFSDHNPEGEPVSREHRLAHQGRSGSIRG